MASILNFNTDFHHEEIDAGAKLTIADDVMFGAFTTVVVRNNAELIIGDRVFFNSYSSINCEGRIEIGKDTMFGCGVRVIDSNHEFSNYHVEKLRFVAKPITIGKNCWIGANSVILAGVTIGDNVIVGANCTIYKDVPANSIVLNNSQPIYRDRPQKDFHAFTLTASADLEHLAYLVEHLPQVEFHIAAQTNVHEHLANFSRYPNVTIYTNVHHWDIIEDLLDKADIYLDINQMWEVEGILSQVNQREKPIFAFDNVVHGEQNQLIFSHEHPEEMVQEIQALLMQKVSQK